MQELNKIETKELKPKSFRITTEIFDKFKEISSNIGGNQQEAFEKLIEAYELQQGKLALKEEGANVDQFQKYVACLTRMYVGSLEDKQNIKSLVYTEFEKQLKSKDEIIQDLQEQLKKASEQEKEAIKKAKASEEKVEQLNQYNIKQEKTYNTTLNGLQDNLKEKEFTLKECKTLNSILTGSCDSLKEQMEQMKADVEKAKEQEKKLESLQKEYDKLKSDYDILESNLSHVKKEHDKTIKEMQKQENEALKRAKEQCKFDQEKAIFELNKAYLEEKKNLQEEYMQKIKSYIDLSTQNNNKSEIIAQDYNEIFKKLEKFCESEKTWNAFSHITYEELVALNESLHNFLTFMEENVEFEKDVLCNYKFGTEMTEFLLLVEKLFDKDLEN